MEKKTCKVAVVGCGVISKAYMKSIREFFSVLEIVACTDLDVERMNATAEEYGIKAMTMDEILADPEIEIVLNLTNPAAHYPITKQLLEAGKNVWSEKMIAVDLEQGKELVKIAEAHNVRLGVAPDTFLGGAIQTARYIVDKGLIGKPLTFTASISRDYGVFGEILPHLRKKGGSILFDMGGYYLTALANLFGPVREVSAFTATNEPERKGSRLDNDMKYFEEPYTVEVSNMVAASLKYDCGVIGTLHMNSDCLYTETTGITVFGTEGILYMPDPNRFGGEVKLQKLQSEPIVFPLTHGYQKNSRGIGAAEMAWSMLKGRLHRANMYLAQSVFETAHAIETASAEKRVVTLESTFERPAALPEGYIDNGFWGPMPEASLAL